MKILIISQNYCCVNVKPIKTIEKSKLKWYIKRISKIIKDKDTKGDYNDKNCKQSDKAMNAPVSKRVFDLLILQSWEK